MTRIDVLPDDVLLEIFDFYVVLSLGDDQTGIEAWQQLVHVCRRWRFLVFESPRRLNLRLLCTLERRIGRTLVSDVWPALPLVIEGIIDYSRIDMLPDMCNVMAALRQISRVSQVYLIGLTGWQFEDVFAAMQVPFPELTQIKSDGEIDVPDIPDSFLGGSAPRL